MKGFAARNDDPDRYRSISMQTLIILKVSIVEWILIVPLNFECYPRPVFKSSDMIHLVGLAFFRNSVDPLLDNKGCLDPTLCSERLPKTLCALGFASAARDNLLDRDGRPR